MKDVIIPKNVLDFLNKASDAAGCCYAESFNIDAWSEIREFPIESPIEQLLYIALKAVRDFMGEENDDLRWMPDKKEYIFGIGIDSQIEIGKYRVDFIISDNSIKRFTDHWEQITKKLIVECDSQEWHERTEQERRYEKKRDRDLTKEGYQVYHYTGKEIINDPVKIAVEIMSFIKNEELSLKDYRNFFNISRE